MKYGMKIVAALAALVLAVGLVACGGNNGGGNGGGSAAKTVDSIYETVLAANPIEVSREITDTNLELDFMLSAEDVAEFKGVQSNSQEDAGLVLVVRCAEGKADTVKEELEAYMQDQEIYWGLYPEFADALANVEKGVVQAGGDFVVIAFPSNSCAGADAVASAVSSALG